MYNHFVFEANANVLTQIIGPYSFFIEWYHKIITSLLHLLYRFWCRYNDGTCLVIILLKKIITWGQTSNKLWHPLQDHQMSYIYYLVTNLSYINLSWSYIVVLIEVTGMFWLCIYCRYTCIISVKLTSIALNIGADTPMATSYSPHSLGLRSRKVENILYIIIMHYAYIEKSRNMVKLAAKAIFVWYHGVIRS